MAATSCNRSRRRSPDLPTTRRKRASCAAEERSLAMIWQKFEGLPVREIPTELYEKTRDRILNDLKREKSQSPWPAKIPPGPWRALVPIAAGLATTAISYGLIHRIIDP